VKRLFFKSENFIPSSSLTLQKKPHDRQDNNFFAKRPCILSLQKVPEIAQHILPPFFPLLNPSAEVSIEALHTLDSEALSPPNSLPHPTNSQQLIF